MDARLRSAARMLNTRHAESAAYYDLALESIEAALTALEGGAADERFAALLVPGATVADAYRAAARLYNGSTLPAVTDLEAFQAAYLPGRSPNATRLAHPRHPERPAPRRRPHGR